MVLIGLAVAAAVIATEKPASHWAPERKNLDEESPPYWR
jgi:hypothetical protein